MGLPLPRNAKPSQRRSSTSANWMNEMLRDDAAPQRRAQEEGARAWSSSKGDVERLGRRLATLWAGPKGGLELSSRQKAAIFRASADLPPAETTSLLNARRDEKRAIRQLACLWWRLP